MTTLALVPARGGSKGLPRKNLRELAGLPLVAHAIRFARLCPEIERVVVSTDDEEIAAVAREHGAEVPFLRPAELARDETAMWPVVRHALAEVDPEGRRHERVLLLDPTSPARLPEDVTAAHALLAGDASADGVVAVSQPRFNPLWTTVTVDRGYVRPADDRATRVARRQDLPRALRISGLLYLWRAAFVQAVDETWLRGRMLPLEVPERRAFSIDGAEELEELEALVAAGLVRLPWLP